MKKLLLGLELLQEEEVVATPEVEAPEVDEEGNPVVVPEVDGVDGEENGEENGVDEGE